MEGTYYTDEHLKIRAMKEADAQILYDTYLSYNWYPNIETYRNDYKEQQDGKRKVFIAEYETHVAGICTLVLEPIEGPFGNQGIPEIVDLCVFYHLHNRGIGNKLLDIAEQEAEKVSDKVYLAVGVHSGYGVAQRIYIKRGYIPDGTGVWYKGKQLEQNAQCYNDDDLLLFLSKTL